MSKEIRTAVIGFGGMGSRYAKLIYDGAIQGMTLSGVCCRNQKGQDTLKESYPGVKIYKDTDILFEDSGAYDAVILCTPHPSHVPLGLTAASLGKHIMCEKPAGVTAKEVQRLVDAAQNAGTSLAMMFNNRTKHAYVKAKEMLLSGMLGTVTRSVWICNHWYRTPCYHNSSSWRSTWQGEGGGLLINQCQHSLDLWQWILGIPDEIYAGIDFGKYNDISVDDCADLQFTYKNGLRGTLIASTGENPGIDRWDIWGSKGRLTIINGNELIFDENETDTHTFSLENTVPFAALKHSLRKIDLDEDQDMYELMLQNFSDHLRFNTPLIAPGSEGLAAVELMNAAYMSAWKERKVSIPVNADAYELILATKKESENKAE